MNEIPLERFLEAIRQTHGAEAELVERVYIDERFEDDPVWQGEVLVFDLLDHPAADRCYAWEVDGEVTAVLGVGAVDSPQAAVRAAILADAESWTESH